MSQVAGKEGLGKRKDFQRWGTVAAGAAAEEKKTGAAAAFAWGDGDVHAPPVRGFTSTEQRRAAAPAPARPPMRDLGEKPVALNPMTSYDRAFQHQADWGTDHLKMLKISSADYSGRPARKQAEKQVNLQAPEGCNEFNIWHGRWMGEQWRDKNELVAQLHRCVVRRDAGRTQADERFGETAYCCLFFARGACHLGPDCTFLHRVPTSQDDAKIDIIHDMFGRDRHSTDRDDMRGTGNFNRASRALYIGGLKIMRGAEQTHKSLLRHMSEWGEVEQLRIIPSKAIAFVTFKHRVAAEFALEAMHCQTLDSDELLNIRWAYDDRNPAVIAMAEQALKDTLNEALQAQGISLTQTAYLYPQDYHPIQAAPSEAERRLNLNPEP